MKNFFPHLMDGINLFSNFQKANVEKFMLNNATKVCPYTILQKCALIHNEGYIPLKVRLVVLGQEKLSVYRCLVKRLSV